MVKRWYRGSRPRGSAPVQHIAIMGRLTGVDRKHDVLDSTIHARTPRCCGRDTRSHVYGSHRDYAITIRVLLLTDYSYPWVEPNECST
jgi:hypothetical protein